MSLCINSISSESVPVAAVADGFALIDSVGKRAGGGDCTVAVLASPELIRRVFQDMLQVTVVSHGHSPSRVAGFHQRAARLPSRC